jgi:hypothetical protein
MHFHIGFVKNRPQCPWNGGCYARRPVVKLSFDQVMLVLAGLAAGCDRASPDIVPEGPRQSAPGASAEAVPVQNSAAPPPPVKAAPTASTVVAKEVTPQAKSPPATPAGSAKPKEMGCAPGGCAPGKCG